MLTILYEDNHLLAINKESGTLVQGDATGDRPLVDICKDYIKEKYQKHILLKIMNFIILINILIMITIHPYKEVLH